MTGEFQNGLKRTVIANPARDARRHVYFSSSNLHESYQEIEIES